MKQIGIYSNHNVTPEVVSLLSDFFGMSDMVIFSSAPYNIDDPSIAVVSIYHMFFYGGIIIFTNESDMKKYIPSLKTKKIFLVAANSIVGIDTREAKNELRQSI